MSAGPGRFRDSDLRRAIRVARAEGCGLVAVKIERDRAEIVVDLVKTSDTPGVPNSDYWDRVTKVVS